MAFWLLDTKIFFYFKGAEGVKKGAEEVKKKGQRVRRKEHYMNYERRGYFFLDAKFNANFIEVCIQKFGACKTIGDCQRRNHERGNGYLVFILEFIFQYFLDISIGETELPT